MAKVMNFGTVEDSVKDILTQIKLAKAKGKKSIKVKTFTSEPSETGRPKNVFMKVGMFEGGSGVEELRKLGYSVEFTKTDKQATNRMIRGVSVTTVKTLYTTTMPVSW